MHHEVNIVAGTPVENLTGVYSTVTFCNISNFWLMLPVSSSFLEDSFTC